MTKLDTLVNSCLNLPSIVALMCLFALFWVIGAVVGIVRNSEVALEPVDVFVVSVIVAALAYVIQDCL